MTEAIVHSSLERWLAARSDSAPSPGSKALEALSYVAPAGWLGDELAHTLAALDRLGADGPTLAAAIAYDVGPAAAQRLGAGADPVAAPAHLVEGQRQAEQVWSIHANGPMRDGGEGLRRLLLAICGDVRVVLILLARQVARMRVAAHGDDDGRRDRLAALAADLLAPLANRLGIWELKWELEDLVFRFREPKQYARIAGLLHEKRSERERYIASAVEKLREALAGARIDAQIEGRAKHIYSIHRKMQRKSVPFGELYDVRALRVLVEDVAQCYAALGVAHSLWSPVPQEFDDYIARPKPNGYRSLHTAVIGPQGATVEVQIRTLAMHRESELGVAAHWRYKESATGPDADFERWIGWLRGLLEHGDGGELEGALASDLAPERTYLLTPAGEVVDVPAGGTVLDFAYHVHTEVGHRCRGAKVNGRIVPLDHAPGTGDRVEILTHRDGVPRRDWLLAGNAFLRSSRARSKVRAWFHRLDASRNIAAGRQVVERELRRIGQPLSALSAALTALNLDSPDALYSAVALGDISLRQVARALGQPLPAARDGADSPAMDVATLRMPAADGIAVDGVGNLAYQLARCCQPIPGDAITGYMTATRGLTIHRDGCAALARVAARFPERLLPSSWGRGHQQGFTAELDIKARDRKDLLQDIMQAVSAMNLTLVNADTRLDSGRAEASIRLRLSVGDFGQLSEALGRLSAVRGVITAQRRAEH